MRSEVLVMEKRMAHAEAVSVLNGMVSQTDFNKGKAGEIFGRVQKNGRVIVLKNNKPSAVILSPEEYARLAEFEEDLHLLTEAEERMKSSDLSDSVSEKDAMARLGVIDAELDAAPDVEIK